MAFTRLNFRCTYAEEERWKAEARKTGRSLSAWIRWLANTASESPPLESVALAGGVATEAGSSPFGGLPAMPAPVSKPGYVVEVELDWDTKLPVVTINGEDVGWRGEPTVLELRAREIPGSVIAEIRKKLRELN